MEYTTKIQKTSNNLPVRTAKFICLISTSSKRGYNILTTYIYNERNLERMLKASKSGGYLLSHNKCTTIGVAELNDPVRNGKGWDLSAITT